MTRIAVVEDSDLAVGLVANLEMEGYTVELAQDGRRGLALARTAPDLVVLDMMLPDLDGLHILRTLRQEAHTMPVLVLTARGQESDKVVALKLGADDYLTKPFGLLEFLARVEALLRRARSAGGSAPARYSLAGLELCEATRTVTDRGRALDLTPKEFDLLRELLKADGSVVTRPELLRRVWGYRSEVVSRTLDTHVAELRRKLETGPDAPRIVTVRKIGYRIVPP
jgi:two-component system alkaline phosphatase synthesis response regulator PhoP